MKKILFYCLLMAFLMPLVKLQALTVEEETQKLRDFLELRDESGMRNGDKISKNYSPEDVKTWLYICKNQDGFVISIDWKYVEGAFNGKLIGNLDLSDLEYLNNLKIENNLISAIDVSGCKRLVELVANSNLIGSINLQNCIALTGLDLSNNKLDVIDVENCISLINFKCSNNGCNEFNFTNNPELKEVICTNNKLTFLDLSNNLQLYNLSTKGNFLTGFKTNILNRYLNVDVNDPEMGYVYHNGYYYVCSGSAGSLGPHKDVVAISNDGYKFEGWYLDGVLFSENSELKFKYNALSGNLTAMFRKTNYVDKLNWNDVFINCNGRQIIVNGDFVGNVDVYNLSGLKVSSLKKGFNDEALISVKTSGIYIVVLYDDYRELKYKIFVN